MSIVPAVDPDVPDSACYPTATADFRNSIPAPQIGLDAARLNSDNLSADGPTSQLSREREVLFHFSCKRCHHFHSRRRLQLPADDTHKRYLCDRCEDPIFGIGTNSTQISLASQETITSWGSPSDQVYGEASSVIACSDHRAVEKISPDIPDGPSTDQCVANQQITPPRKSRASSQVGTSQNNGALTDTSTLDVVHPISKTVHTTPQGYLNNQKQVEEESNPKSIRISPSSEHRLRAKITPNRLWNHLKRSFHPSRYRDQHRSGTVPPRITQQMVDASTSTKDLGLGSENSRGDSTALQQDSPTTRDLPDKQQSEIPDKTVHKTEPDEVIEGSMLPEAEKAERLRRHRREATLRSNRLHKRKCMCSEGCHCMGNEGSSAPASVGSRVLANIPQHPFGHLLRISGSPSTTSNVPVRPHSPSRHIAFTGAHLEDHRRSMPQNITGMIDEDLRFSRQSTSTNATFASHTSQATTFVNSSSSGSRTNPQQSQRSDSVPAISTDFLRLLDIYINQGRPEVLAALRAFNVSHSSHSDDLVSEGESQRQGPSRPASTDLSHQQIHASTEALGTHATAPRGNSAISLSQMPEPSDMQRTASSQNGENGTTSDTATIIRVDGSSENTPQSQTFESGPLVSPNVNPDDLSRVIQELQNSRRE